MATGDRKKPAADFIVRMVGPGMRPWSVPFRNLARVLDAVQRLVDQKDDGEEGSPEAGEANETIPADRTLRLIDIKSSSAAYPVAARNSDLAIRVLHDTGVAIAKPDQADWSAASISAVRELSEVAKSLGCEIEFRRPGLHGKYGDVLAVIRPATISEVEQSAFIYGNTSVYARLERVGGATEMHCGIRLADQPRRMVICHVENADLVRKLGQHLYDDVLLMGRATWLRHGGLLKDLSITGFEPPKSGSFVAALHRIHDAGGSVWDDIKDPDSFIAEMRGA